MVCYAMLDLLYIQLIFYMIVHAKYTEHISCPQDHDCTWSFSYFVTHNLQCTNNNQCPMGFLCCSDCHYQHRVCKSALEIKFQCPSTMTFCKQKYPYLGTQRFKCTNTEECSQGFLCCVDPCYEHKICKKAVEENVCPMDLKICSYPLSYEKTKKHECIKHSQCQTGRYCCFDSCYSHKVCKRKPGVSNFDNNCPISIRKESCPNANLTVSKYSCKINEDCIYGYKCCEDNCYAHKVCKLPNNAFEYQDTHKPQKIRILSLDEQQKCPKVEEKCTKPYSLRLAKKFICFKDEDCKVGQLCCKDSCVKDFKICKTIFDIIPEREISFVPKNYTNSFMAANVAATQTIALNFVNETLSSVTVDIERNIHTEIALIQGSVTKMENAEIKTIDDNKTTASIHGLTFLTTNTDSPSLVTAVTVKKKKGKGRKKLKPFYNHEAQDSVTINNKFQFSLFSSSTNEKAEEESFTKHSKEFPPEEQSFDSVPPITGTINPNSFIIITNEPDLKEMDLEEPSVIDNLSVTTPGNTIDKKKINASNMFYGKIVTRNSDESTIPYPTFDGVVIPYTVKPGNNVTQCLSSNLQLSRKIGSKDKIMANSSKNRNSANTDAEFYFDEVLRVVAQDETQEGSGSNYNISDDED